MSPQFQLYDEEHATLLIMLMATLKLHKNGKLFTHANHYSILTYTAYSKVDSHALYCLKNVKNKFLQLIQVTC